MIDKQNITLSLPKDLLRKAKIFAINHDTSVSGLMVDLLSDLVQREDQYMVAKRGYLATLAQPTNLETNGNTSWSRDSLHERYNPFV